MLARTRHAATTRITTRPTRAQHRTRTVTQSLATSADDGDSSWVQAPQQPIGAEWGQGFVHCRPSGSVLRVDVDTLNESLRPGGALRLRHAMRPDEAFGMLFSFEGVIADTRAVADHAWVALAQRHGRRLPSALLRHPALARPSPEYALVNTLRWAANRREAQALAWELADLTREALPAVVTAPQPGVREWLDALTSHNVPCVLVTSLDRSSVQRCLERTALHDHFNALITAEDEAETISQRLLAAAIKLRRPPNACVHFTASPDGVVAAHNCSMRAVAVQGQYHPHQLKAADVTVGALSELTVYNVRRLFANAGSEFMDLQKQTIQDQDGNSKRRWPRRAGCATL